MGRYYHLNKCVEAGERENRFLRRGKFNLFLLLIAGINLVTHLYCVLPDSGSEIIQRGARGEFGRLFIVLSNSDFLTIVVISGLNVLIRS